MDSATQPAKTHQMSPARIGEIPNPLALAQYIATTPLFQKKRLFVYIPSTKDQNIFVYGLSIFNPNRPCIIWRDNPQTLLSILKPTDDQNSIIVSDQENFNISTLPAPHSFEQQLAALAVNDTMHVSTLKHWLVQNGYEPDTTANSEGKWASRGDIIDVYTDQPIRIVFLGDTIESIHSFDLKTGKQQHSFSSLCIPPIQLNGGSSLTEYLKSDTTTLLFHTEELLNIAQTQISIEPFRLPSVIDAAIINAGYTETKSYNLRFEELQKDIQSFHGYVCTQFTDKAEGLFENNTAIQIVDVDFPIPYHGFIHKESATIALTDTSIGFIQQTQRKKSRRVDQALIQALQPGDIVVHLYHGIARFKGMEIMHVNGLDREFFVLEYANNDKIYLPVELAERIDKYLGDPNPKLHRLSDAGWHEVVARVKQESLAIAHDLLKLYARRSTSTAPQLKEYAEEHALDKECPFQLTSDQQEALKEVLHDLAQEKPMDRLLCGDVGFGKTEVALRVAFRAVLNGYQVALLAPTTILAQQHYDTFVARLGAFGVHIRALNRLRAVTEQKTVLAEMKSGSADIVIGTHRMYSKDVEFKKLGLIIIDEEQRFGVKSKEALLKLRKNSHVLTMTATPIPRTLHLSLSGLRDISTILTPPQERKPVQSVIQQLTPEIIKTAITQEMQRDGQTYYIYNRVQSIEQRKKALQEIVPDARIGIVHGQMAPKQIANVMHEFDVGEIDVLLATTIVENGLDIPRANTMIVENASLFGLSELYQLKGRVGRSHQQGFAYFLYKEQVPEADAKKRFIALQEAQQLGAGFELAMKDMEIRGVGNILGKEQHGHAIKIGMNLYVRLLNQSIQELEGMPEELERDIPIDVPLEARIPEQLVPDNEERIMMYQRLATIRDREELLNKRKEAAHTERFQKDGELHPALAGLFDLLEIKLLASHSTLLSIDTMYPNTHNNLESPRITLTAQTLLHPLPPEWEFVWTKSPDIHKMRSTVKELGDTSQWKEKLKTIIQQLQQ